MKLKKEPCNWAMKIAGIRPLSKLYLSQEERVILEKAKEICKRAEKLLGLDKLREEGEANSFAEAHWGLGEVLEEDWFEEVTKG